MKTETRTYTKQEIEKALELLNKRLLDKKDERKEINQQIKAINDNIKYYEAIDQRQVKIAWGDEA